MIALPRNARSHAVPVVLIAALNAAFLLVVDRYATTEHHLTITIRGTVVGAQLDDGPASEWANAPVESGRFGVRILDFDRALATAGIDNLEVRDLESNQQVLVDRFGRFGAATLPPASGWNRDRRGHLVTSQRTVLWIGELPCRACAIDVDLINTGGVEVFVGARDDRNGLVWRWQRDALTWQAVADGTAGSPHGIGRYLQPASKKYDRFGADLASALLSAYVDGWRFVAWYVRSASPGIVLAALLGLVWRTRVVERLPHLGTQQPWNRMGWAGPLIVGVTAAALGIVWAAAPQTAPFLLAVSSVGLLGVAVGGLLWREVRGARGSEPAPAHHLASTVRTLAVTALCAVAAGVSAYIALVYLEGIPHVQDSASYLLAAKALLTGQLKIPIEADLAPFFQLGTFFEFHDGFLLPIIPGWYFAGHPALLALGCLVHAPWLVNPVSSAITLGLLYLLCRELFGPTTGLIAVGLGVLSPFARLQSASMMTHPSGLLCITAALLCFVYWLTRRRAVYALCTGAMVGALLNVRLYDGAVLGAFIALAGLCVVRRTGGTRALSGAALATLGAIPFLLLISWQVAELGASGGLRESSRRTLEWIPENLDASRIRLDGLNDDLFGWTALGDVPSTLTIGVLLLGILVMPKKRADWFVVAWALLYVAAYASYSWHGNMFGPRYWYGSLGGQLVLVARLLQILPQTVARVVTILWPPGGNRAWRWLPLLVGTVPMLCVAGPLFWRTATQAYPGRYRTEYSQGYNGFSRAPLDLLAQHHVSRGLIFLADLPRWQDLVTAIAANDASLNGDLIFARHIDRRDHILMQARPQHPPYVITWNGTRLELNRLQWDPQSNQVTAVALATTDDDAPALGTTNAFTGVNLPGGIPWQGGLRTDRHGNVYAVDGVNHQVLVFDATGVLKQRRRAAYSFGPAAIKSGHGLAVDDDGTAYVADLDPPGVVCLNADGSFAWRTVPPGDGQPAFASAYDVALLSSGELVVSDPTGSALHRIRRDGSIVGRLGGTGSSVTFQRPYGLAVGPDNSLFVSDVGLQALVQITEAGIEVRRWPLPIAHVEPHEVPYVAVDHRGHAYVANTQGWVVYHARPDRPDLETLPHSVPFPAGLVAHADELRVISAGERKLVRVPLP